MNTFAVLLVALCAGTSVAIFNAKEQVVLSASVDDHDPTHEENVAAFVDQFEKQVRHPSPRSALSRSATHTSRGLQAHGVRRTRGGVGGHTATRHS
jgi:hypothetical protein